MVQRRNSALVANLEPDFARSNHTHIGGGSVSLALNDLTDVLITAAAAGDYLRNDGVGQWVDVAVGQLLLDLITVDGSGSGLDADLLDGLDSTAFQGIDPTLTALAAFNTNGFLVQTAADTFAGRTLQPGTAIGITNPAGTAGDPTIAVNDAELLALAGLTSAADQLPYFTGLGTAALTTLTTFIRTLLDDVDALTARATLGVTIGTNVQAFDAFLTSIALLGTAADRMIYTTGVDTAAETVLTSFIRTLLDDANQAAAQATLGLAPGTNVQAFDAFLTSIAALGTAADRMIYTTAIDTAAETVLTAFARSFLDDATEAAFKATVNLEIGVDVQAFDADLSALAALAATAGMLSRTGAGAFAVRTLTAPAAGITISNGTGSAGNPTWALANDLSALEGLASSGFAARTGTDTWAIRTLAEGNNIAITNPAGTAGNPSIAATPSGSDGNIQYNNSTVFGGDANFGFDDTNDIVFISDSGVASLARLASGLELRVGTTAIDNLTPALKFTSTDASFTTENPKLLAAIAGIATEDYAADTDGGMSLNFYVTGDNPGTTNVPALVMQLARESIILGEDEDFAFDDTNNIASISGAASGSLSRTMPGLELRMGASVLETGTTPTIKFMSTDSSFTTENPKLLAAINGAADESYTADTHGGMSLVFSTTPATPGTTSVPVNRMIIGGNGLTRMWNSSSFLSGSVQGVLTAHQNDTAGALPVISLDQRDDDQPFMWFRTTSANADLTRGIVDDADVTTATRVGWLKIAVDDVGNQVADTNYFQPFYTLA